MAKIAVTIKGVVPLLQHRFQDEKESTDPPPNRGKVDYSDEAEKSLYRNEKGEIYQPADHILGSMIKAAVDFKIAGKRGKTYKDMVKAAIVITPDAIPHKNQKWTIDRRRVVIQRSAIMRERPKFEDWELSFNIEILDDQFPISVVKDITERAGKIGLGDYRPKFGRFMVTEFKEL